MITHSRPQAANSTQHATTGRNNRQQQPETERGGWSAAGSTSMQRQGAAGKHIGTNGRQRLEAARGATAAAEAAAVAVATSREGVETSMRCTRDHCASGSSSRQQHAASCISTGAARSGGLQQATEAFGPETPGANSVALASHTRIRSGLRDGPTECRTTEARLTGAPGASGLQRGRS